MQQLPRSPLASRENLPDSIDYMTGNNGTEATQKNTTSQGKDSTPPAVEKHYGISQESVERNARAVLYALNSPPIDGNKSDLHAAFEAAASPCMPPSPELSTYNLNLEDTDAQNRFQAALQALETVQYVAASRAPTNENNSSNKTADQQQSMTPGQQLAKFLKEQLLEQQSARFQAETRVAALAEELKAFKKQAKQDATTILHNEESLTKLVSENMDLKSKLQQAQNLAQESIQAAAASKRDLESVRRDAAIKLENAHQKLADVEMKMHLGSTFDVRGDGRAPSPLPASSKPTEETERNTVIDHDYHDASKLVPESPSDGTASLPLLDVFAAIDTHQDVESDADSEDSLIDEAAEAVKDIARMAALKAHRMDDMEQAVVRSRMAAQRRHSVATEERLLRSEIATLQRKCERSDHMLVRANHALQVLKHKLTKERQTIASLNEEKCLLQSQLLVAQRQPSLDAEQLGSLLEELRSCRGKIEQLTDERATLAGRLETAEGQLTAADQERHIKEREAAHALSEEKSRSDALERQVQGLLGELGASSATVSQLEASSSSLHEAQARCGQLAAELEAKRVALIERENEVDQLTELAQAFANEVMTVKEAEARERTRAEQLVHENAGLIGRVESLSDAVSRLERSDGVLESLAGDKAELQGRLNQAESAARAGRAAADAARAEVEAQCTYTVDLESQIGVLESELAAAEEHHEALQCAAAAAAEQLARLAESHAKLQKELEHATNEAGTSKNEAATLSQRLRDAEDMHRESQQRIAFLQAELEAGQARETSLTRELHEATTAAREAFAEIDALSLATNRLQRERGDALGRIDRLDATIRVLNAEIEALKRAGAVAEGTAQTLVDNVCDMSGLIDAVSSLQQRNRLLHEECAATATRATDAENERDALRLEKSSVERELENERERLASELAAKDVLQQTLEGLRGDHAVATRQLSSLKSEHGKVKKTNAALQESNAEMNARLTTALSENDRLTSDVYRLTSSLDEATQQATSFQNDLQAVLVEKEKWLDTERQLRETLAETDKARGLAEGKLVLAANKENKFKAASHCMRQLKDDIDAHLVECHALRQEKTAAEDRCSELGEKCTELLGQISSLEAKVSHAHNDVNAKQAQHDALEEQLHATQLDAMRLAEELTAAQSLSSKIALLQEDKAECDQWCDELTAELNKQTEELEAIQTELRSALFRADAAETSLAAMTERAIAAENTAASLEAEREEACVGLGVSEETVRSLQEELHELEKKHHQSQQSLEHAESARARAEELAETKDAELIDLRNQLILLQQALAVSQAAKVAVEEALQRRVAELEVHVADSAAQNAALDEARRQQIEELQVAVQAGSSACNTLAAKLEVAAQGQRDALEELDRLRAEYKDAENELHRAESEVEGVVKQLEEAKKENEELAEDAATAGRHAEMLETQCNILRGQLDFLHASHAKDADLSQDVRDQLSAAYEEARRLREELSLQARALDDAKAETASLHGKLGAVQHRTDEALRQATDAGNAARDAHAAQSQAEQRVASLEQQLELSELLKEQGQRDVEVAREQIAAARADALAAQQAAEEALRQRDAALSESRAVVHDVFARLAAQMAALKRVESMVFSSSVAAAAKKEDDGYEGDTTTARDGRAMTSADLLALAEELDAVPVGPLSTIPIHDAANIDTAHNAFIDKLSSVRSAVDTLASQRKSQEEEQQAARRALAAWDAEKRVMNAVCKLALAVMMDNIGGGNDAGAIATELDDLVRSHASHLEESGLSTVWSSLRRIAHSGAGRRLLQQADELRARCVQLEEDVNRRDASVSSLQAVLKNETARVCRLTGSVQWATGDLWTDGTAATVVAGDESPSLSASVDALTKEVQRLVARYRSLSRTALSLGTLQMEESANAGWCDGGCSSKRTAGSGGGGGRETGSSMDTAKKAFSSMSLDETRDTIPAHR